MVKTTIIFLWYFWVIQVQAHKTVIVETTTGRVRGKYDSSTQWTFLGIPFAEPPIGNLRFEPPVPKTKWTNTLDSTNYKPACIQETGGGQEDCLFLNIFTPKMAPFSKLPVLFIIHGGAFLVGSGNMTGQGPEYFLNQHIVVVTIQYRLGIFGFLSTGDDIVPGNNGLRDQILALKWTKKNIEKFGGDSNKITLFGQSAGAVSISYHLQNKHTKGLYQRAIMDSGVSLCLWSLSRSVWENTQKLAAKLMISSNNKSEIIEKLKSVNEESLRKNVLLIGGTNLLLSNPMNGFTYGPVIEVNSSSPVISRNSHELLTRGKFNRIPILLGHNTLEISLGDSAAIKAYLLKYDLDFSLLAPIDMNLKNKLKELAVGGTVKMEYFGLQPLATSDEKVMQFISDNVFVRPVQEFARLWSRFAPSYLYVFSYRGEVVNNTSKGTAHTEELHYLLKMHESLSSSDSLTSKRMVKMWSDFVKFGNPIPKKIKLLNMTTWPKVGGNDRIYLDIAENLSVKKDYRSDKMGFWASLYSKNGNPPYNTY